MSCRWDFWVSFQILRKLLKRFWCIRKSIFMDRHNAYSRGFTQKLYAVYDTWYAPKFPASQGGRPLKPMHDGGYALWYYAFWYNQLYLYYLTGKDLPSRLNILSKYRWIYPNAYSWDPCGRVKRMSRDLEILLWLFLLTGGFWHYLNPIASSIA